MAQNTKECSKMKNSMVMVNLHGQVLKIELEMYMKDIGKMVKWKGVENSDIKLDAFSKVFSRIICTIMTIKFS
jgi:hypothetical protein